VTVLNGASANNASAASARYARSGVHGARLRTFAAVRGSAYWPSGHGGAASALSERYLSCLDRCGSGLLGGSHS
jgi:hypothetical protein